MLFWTLKITIISIILIFLIHNVILFLKATLTVPKLKDLINAPAQKYENIYNIISPKDYISSLLPAEDDCLQEFKSMKDELTNYLKNNQENLGTSDIASLDSITLPSPKFTPF